MGGLEQLIEQAAATHGVRSALLAADREPLSYSSLPAVVGGMTAQLRERGIGPADRVALVVDNGPEAATAFLALACGAACAPLNPAYREQEFGFYLDDLAARAVVVGETVGEPVRAAASAMGIDVIELQ